MANHDWLELIKDMLWCFERETKFTLRGINDDFKHIGLSFDPDFRFQFLDIIVNRIARTYDEFIVNLVAEQHQLAAINAQTEHSSIASNGRKRKITCDNDDNASDGCNDTLVVKRARKNDVNTVDAATNTADSAAAAVTDDDDFNQNPDNYITDDNSNSEQSKRATAQQNGQRSIEQNEAFKQGYVVVIPMRTTNEPEVADSESSSSATNRQTPATSVGSVVKEEPSFEIDTEGTSTDAASSSKPQPPPSSSELPSKTRLIIRLPHVPKTPGQQASGPSSAEDNELSSNSHANDLTPVRVTRQSSRERTLKTSSTPSNPIPSNVVTIASSNGSIAVNQNTPNSSKTPKSSVKKPRRKSTAQEPAQSYRCKQCAYATAWKCNFVRHLLIHNDESIDLEHLQCEKCAHLTKPSPNVVPSKRNSTANEVEDLAFACNLCSKKFTAKDLLDMHHTTVHRNQCPKCKKKFANGQQASAHSKRCQ